MKKKQKKVLSIFMLAMMNVAIILSLRGLPLMAKEGTTMVFYLLFSLVFFLIPTALVSAELATGWPEEGGVFRWVSLALGPRFGFMAIFLQWTQNIFYYPAILAFAAGALAYLFLSPELAQSSLFSIGVILVIYWGATFINFRGVKASGWVSSLGVSLGTLLPAVFIIILGIIWWAEGRPIQLETEGGWIPDLSNFSNLTFLAGILLLFAGMEVNAVHALEVKNPKRSYPLAIGISVVIIFVVFFLGSLAVGAVVQADSLSLTAGVMQAFSQFLDYFRIAWLVPVIGFLVALGTIGGVAAWIVGPSKGLLATAKKGMIPPWLSYANKKRVPVHILIVQGGIVSLISLLFMFTKTVSGAFFLLTDLAILLYLIMYVLLFISAITLRYTKPNKERPYKIPGGMVGIWIVAGTGIIGALFAFVVGFFPPDQLKYQPTFFVLFLAIGVFLGILIPNILYSLKHEGWKKKTEKYNHDH